MYSFCIADQLKSNLRMLNNKFYQRLCIQTGRIPWGWLVFISSQQQNNAERIFRSYLPYPYLIILSVETANHSVQYCRIDCHCCIEIEIYQNLLKVIIHF